MRGLATFLLSTVCPMILGKPQYGAAPVQTPVAAPQINQAPQISCITTQETIWDTQYIEKTEKECHQEQIQQFRQSCQTVYKNSCQTVNKQVCSQQYRQESQPYTETECSSQVMWEATKKYQACKLYMLYCINHHIPCCHANFPSKRQTASLVGNLTVTVVRSGWRCLAPASRTPMTIVAMFRSRNWSRFPTPIAKMCPSSSASKFQSSNANRSPTQRPSRFARMCTGRSLRG